MLIDYFRLIRLYSFKKIVQIGLLDESLESLYSDRVTRNQGNNRLEKKKGYQLYFIFLQNN